MNGLNTKYSGKFTGPDRGFSLGFTLIELMVVIAVIFLLMGIGVVALMQISKGYETLSEASVVVSYLQGTRNLAVSSGMPADLRFEVIDNRTVMKMSGLEVSGSFLMEDATGSFGSTFNPVPGTFTEGISGNCLRFDNDKGAVNLGNDPRWDMNSGFMAECWVRLEPVVREVTVMKKNGLFSLSLVPTLNDRLMYMKVTVTEADLSETDILLEAIPLEFSRWVKLGISWKTPVLTLYQDSIPVYTGNFPSGFSADSSGDLMILDCQDVITCCLDELMLYRYGLIGERSLSEGASIPELQTKLSDADPDNDFLRFTFMPDGRFRELTQYSLMVSYRNSIVTVMLSTSGEVYISGL